MNKLYLVDTGFCGEFMVDIYLTNNIENAKKQVVNIIKKFKEFYPDIQFVSDDYISYSSDKGHYRYGSLYIQIRTIEILFKYNSNDTVFLAEYCSPSVIDFELPAYIKELPIEQQPLEYPKIKEYFSQIALQPVSGNSCHQVFATQSDAEQYLARFSNDDNSFVRITSFKNGFPVLNENKP